VPGSGVTVPLNSKEAELYDGVAADAFRFPEPSIPFKVKSPEKVADKGPSPSDPEPVPPVKVPEYNSWVMAVFEI
jgi:hypothetical protein